MATLNVLSLFAGIGGLELGLERAGMTVVGQVEIDDYCRRVLAKHWPEVPRHDDVRTCVEWWTDSPCNLCGGLGYVGGVTGDCYCRRSRRGQFAGDRAPRAFNDGRILRKPVDVICGGFPCQDISNAGRRAGIGGERSGLWSYMADAVRVLRPRYVVMENVSAILVRGLDVVTADLASCGYDVQWDCIPAAAVGATHRRDRWWGVAYPQEFGSQLRPATGQRLGRPASSRREKHLAYTDGAGLEVGESTRLDADTRGRCGPDGNGQRPGAVAIADREGPAHDRQGSPRRGLTSQRSGACGATGDSPGAIFAGAGPRVRHWWAAEPDVGRVAHGVPARVDRLRALGNAVVPQVAEHIGRLLIDFDAASEAA